MSQKIYFTPGPAHLYPTVENHVKQAFVEDIGSISHRSKKFHEIYQHADTQLRQLLGIPSGFHILFGGSATEFWERSLESLVEEESFHFVNGSFSKRFYEIGLLLKKKSQKTEVPFGQGFDISKITIPSATELICVTSNETSSGVYMPEKDIHQLKDQHPNALLIVDAVSSVPYPSFDFTKVDSVLFSVQKAFGLPAGLGVWIVNDRCLAKAEALKQKGGFVGTYHNLVAMVDNAKKWETPSTPNVLNMYLLGKVAEDMNNIGAETIRKQTLAKAQTLYQWAEKSTSFAPSVQVKEHRSPTVVVLNTPGSAAQVIETIKPTGMIIGSGYGAFKDQQIRIANFPCHTQEHVEALIAALDKHYS